MSMMCPCSNLKSLQIIAQIKEVKALNRRIKGLNPSRFQIGWHLIHLPLDTQDVHPGSLIPSSQVIATACGDVPSSVNGELGEK
jgi:deoxycytidylate deaminase